MWYDMIQTHETWHDMRWPLVFSTLHIASRLSNSFLAIHHNMIKCSMSCPCDMITSVMGYHVMIWCDLMYVGYYIPAWYFSSNLANAWLARFCSPIAWSKRHYNTWTGTTQHEHDRMSTQTIEQIMTCHRQGFRWSKKKTIGMESCVYVDGSRKERWLTQWCMGVMSPSSPSPPPAPVLILLAVVCVGPVCCVAELLLSGVIDLDHAIGEHGSVLSSQLYKNLMIWNRTSIRGFGTKKWLCPNKTGEKARNQWHGDIGWDMMPHTYSYAIGVHVGSTSTRSYTEDNVDPQCFVGVFIIAYTPRTG